MQVGCVFVPVVNFDFDNLTQNFLARITDSGRRQIRAQHPLTPVQVRLIFTADFGNDIEPKINNWAQIGFAAYLRSRDQAQNEHRYVKVDYTVHKMDSERGATLERIRAFLVDSEEFDELFRLVREWFRRHEVRSCLKRVAWRALTRARRGVVG